MTCRRIGQSGLSRSIRLKKCGVTASASFVPERRTPLRSSFDNSRCCSSWASEVTRFFSCHFQSFQSFAGTSGQYPGACVTNSFPSILPGARATILFVERKVSGLNNHVNGGTSRCAWRVVLRGDPFAKWHLNSYRRLRVQVPSYAKFHSPPRPRSGLLLLTRGSPARAARNRSHSYRPGGLG